MQPLRISACPVGGDEYGRPFFEIFNPDYTMRTMFYADLPNHFYRREQCLITNTFLIRESFSFPIVSEDGFHKTYTHPSDVQLALEVPMNAHGWGVHYGMVINLQNTFTALSELAKFPDEEIKNLYYDVIVKRLHDDRNSENYQRALDRLTSSGFTQASPHIFRIEPGVVFEDIFYTEISEDNRIDLFRLFDPIEVQMFGRIGENAVAINLSRGLDSLYKIPVVFNQGVYSFSIAEAGIYAIVEDDFEAEYIIHELYLADLDDLIYLAQAYEQRQLQAEIPEYEQEEREPFAHWNYIIISFSAGASAIIIIALLIRERKKAAESARLEAERIRLKKERKQALKKKKP
jgi:hypothetical protein